VSRIRAERERLAREWPAAPSDEGGNTDTSAADLSPTARELNSWATMGHGRASWLVAHAAEGILGK
jgi:hypothetical protein